MRLDPWLIGDLMNLSILNCLSKKIGGLHHMKADLRLHLVIGLRLHWCIRPLTNLSMGHLHCSRRDTHHLGICPIPLSIGLILQHTGFTLMSLGNTFRSVLTNHSGSVIYLQPRREIMDVEILIQTIASSKVSRSKPLLSIVN